MPQSIDLESDNGETVVYFRSREELNSCKLIIKSGEKIIAEKKYPFLRPPEMERLTVDFSRDKLDGSSPITAEIEVNGK